jgi:hypothetical protein
MAIDAALGRLGIRPGVCTSSTRPANPFEGQVIYETDTNNIRFWSGSAWESNKGGIVSSSAPTGAAAGDIWYDSDDGRAYIYYDDGSSQQWVEFGAAPSGSSITLASYADSAARTTAIPSPTEADLSYLQDTNSVEVYDGSAWAAVGGGQSISYTPTLTNWTATAVIGRYVQIGKLVHVFFEASGTITCSGIMRVTVPVTAAAGNRLNGHHGIMLESGVAWYPCMTTGFSTTSFDIYALTQSGSSVRWLATSAASPFTWGAGDAVSITFSYEAA